MYDKIHYNKIIIIIIIIIIKGKNKKKTYFLSALEK